MLAKMIDKIVSLKETKTFEIGGQTYTDGHLTRIPPHVDRPESISVSGLEPWEIGPAIEKAAKDAETATATKMAECIAGGIRDTVEAIHRDPDGFFKGGAR